MRILYIITQGRAGGAQNYVLALARHFHGAIACGTENTELLEKAELYGLETFPLPHLKRAISPFSEILAAWEIRELIKTYQPDIVHLNSSKAGILGSYACWGLKTKVVFTAHGFVFNEPLPWAVKSFYLALEKDASRYRDQIISISDADREAALKFGLVDEQKISTIHNGLAKIEFVPREEALSAFALPADKFLFAAIANFYPTKGLDILIDAVASLPEETKQRCEFIIFGDGPKAENLRLKIKNLSLENSFRLLGSIKNAAQYLKTFNAFVLPSRKEGFPFAVLEAMQAGLPIVATDVGGVKEALGDAGILVPPENPKALFQTIQTLFADKLLQKTLAQKALARSAIFTEEKMFAETEKIYKKLLA